MRTENRNSEGECYQVNSNVKATYNDKKHELTELKIKGEIVKDNQKFTILLQGYHFKNSAENLNISQKELEALGNSKTVTTSAQEVFKEYLMSHQNLTSVIEQRF